MSTVNAIYHIVINTYCREMTIPESSCEEMYRYIWGVVEGDDNKRHFARQKDAAQVAGMDS